MTKIDLSKKHKSYYSAKTRAELISVEPVTYLSTEGKGDPSGQPFALAVQALYAAAYGIKFLCKLREKDFVVPKLEGLWSYDENKYQVSSFKETSVLIPREEWNYRLLIRMPDFVTIQDLTQALTVARMKKKIPTERQVEFFKLPAHRAVQILHQGPFEQEPESLEKIAAFMKEQQLQKGGLHHEIYLSDFRKTPPGKLRTILREPVA